MPHTAYPGQGSNQTQHDAQLPYTMFNITEIGSRSQRDPILPRIFEWMWKTPAFWCCPRDLNYIEQTILRSSLHSSLNSLIRFQHIEDSVRGKTGFSGFTECFVLIRGCVTYHTVLMVCRSPRSPRDTVPVSAISASHLLALLDRLYRCRAFTFSGRFPS